MKQTEKPYTNRRVRFADDGDKIWFAKGANKVKENHFPRGTLVFIDEPKSDVVHAQIYGATIANSLKTAVFAINERIAMMMDSKFKIRLKKAAKAYFRLKVEVEPAKPEVVFGRYLPFWKVDWITQSIEEDTPNARASRTKLMEAIWEFCGKVPNGNRLKEVEDTFGGNAWADELIEKSLRGEKEHEPHPRFVNAT